MDKDQTTETSERGTSAADLLTQAQARLANAQAADLETTSRNREQCATKAYGEAAAIFAAYKNGYQDGYREAKS